MHFAWNWLLLAGQIGHIAQSASGPACDGVRS
jgi:hypothetical protein